MTTRAIAAPTNFRAYLAGTGATGALVAGALVAFLSVAAFVSFKGLPIGGSGSSSNTVVLSGGGAPAAAAVAAAPATAAVAATPAAAPTGAGLAAAGGALAPNATTPGIQPQPPTTGDNGGGLGPGGGGGAGSGPGTRPPPTQPTTPGALSGTVHNVDGAAGRLGIHTNLGGLTDPIVKPVDDAVNQLLNGVGGAVGNPHLGDGSTARSTT